MSRTTILSTWIGLPGLEPAAFADPDFWDITDMLPMAAASMTCEAALVGPGTLQVGQGRIVGPDAQPALATTLHFTRMRDVSLRVAGSLFAAASGGSGA